MSHLPLIDQMRANDDAFKKTRCLFGLETLHRKETDPGTYEGTLILRTNEAAGYRDPMIAEIWKGEIEIPMQLIVDDGSQ